MSCQEKFEVNESAALSIYQYWALSSTPLLGIQLRAYLLRIIFVAYIRGFYTTYRSSESTQIQALDIRRTLRMLRRCIMSRRLPKTPTGTAGLTPTTPYWKHTLRGQSWRSRSSCPRLTRWATPGIQHSHVWSVC